MRFGNATETAGTVRWSRRFPFLGHAMELPNEHRAKIAALIADGETLDPLDLETFYQWTRASYEALEFYPLQQQRFEKYCSSSFDFRMRIYVGTWILRLALRDASSVSTAFSKPKSQVSVS